METGYRGRKYPVTILIQCRKRNRSMESPGAVAVLQPQLYHRWACMHAALVIESNYMHSALTMEIMGLVVVFMLFI